jgi:programmed cell death protein 5
LTESETNEQQAAASRKEQERKAKEQVLRVIFTSEARQRLTNIRIVKPDLAKAIEDQIIQLATSGKLNHQITDEELKRMLSTVPQPKREFKIRWA